MLYINKSKLMNQIIYVYLHRIFVLLYNYVIFFWHILPMVLLYIRGSCIISCCCGQLKDQLMFVQYAIPDGHATKWIDITNISLLFVLGNKKNIQATKYMSSVIMRIIYRISAMLLSALDTKDCRVCWRRDEKSNPCNIAVMWLIFISRHFW